MGVLENETPINLQSFFLSRLESGNNEARVNSIEAECRETRFGGKGNEEVENQLVETWDVNKIRS